MDWVNFVLLIVLAVALGKTMRDSHRRNRALFHLLFEIRNALTNQGVILSELNDEVTAFLDDAVSDYAALNDKYLASLSQNALDQAEIDRITAEQQATIDDQQAVIARLKASDLDPSNPPAPPGDGGGGTPPDSGGGGAPA